MKKPEEKTMVSVYNGAAAKCKQLLDSFAKLCGGKKNMKIVLSVAGAVLCTVIVLSIVLCGGKNTNELPVPEEEKQLQLHFGQTTVCGDFELTVTDFYYTDEAHSPATTNGAYRPKDGYTCANVEFIVKYTGKTQTSFPFVSCSVDYNNGYIFNQMQAWYYNSGINSWLNVGEIDPLTPEFGCKFSFFVPLEVKENIEAPLKVLFYGLDFDAVLSLRPTEEADAEAMYARAATLVSEEKYGRACDLYYLLGDYKDCQERLLQTCIDHYGFVGLSNYFMKNLPQYQHLSGEDIRAEFTGHTYLSAGSSPEVIYSFSEEGTPITPDGKPSWFVENDQLVLHYDSWNWEPRDFCFDIYKVKDGVFFSVDTGAGFLFVKQE